MKRLRNIWLLSLVVKFIISALIPLSADETYYWVWSNKLQLSYFDHPPMVAWLLYLGHFLEPFQHAVRWPAVLLGHCTLGIGCLLLKDIFPEEKIRWWMYLVLFSPLLGFGSIIVTPDLPVVFFWVLSLYILRLTLERGTATSYASLGISLGLGFCAKYHIVLFVPCLLLYLFIEKKWSEVKWKWVPLTLLFGIIFCGPVLFWNYQNNFASFKFQMEHGLESESYDVLWTISYVLGQVLIIFPTILWAAIKAKPPQKLRFVLYFAWLPLGFFFLTSFRALVEANWAIIALPGVCILAISSENIQHLISGYIKFWTTIILIVVTTLFIPASRELDPKLKEPFDFQQLSLLALDYQPLFAGSYQMASSIWYFSKVPTFKLSGISRFDFFDTLKDSFPTGKHFYLVKNKNTHLPTWIIKNNWIEKKVKEFPPEYILLEFTQK